MAIASKPTPKGWPRISASPTYLNAAAAIDYLVRVFGFDVRLKVEGEGGRIEHSELTLGEGLIMVGDPKPERDDRDHRKSPTQVGGANTICLMVFVDDVDAHCEHARKQGATIANEPKTSDYGEDYWADRTYEAIDLEGHHWWFTQRMRG